MPNPPQYNYTKLEKKTEFLCQRGEKVYVAQLNSDKQRKKNVNSLEAYYSKSSTNVPVEILNTGNISVLTNYLSNHSGELNEKEKKHLEERVDVMQHLNELEKHFQANARKSTGKMVEQNGKKVFPGIVLDRKQDTNNGCWSCAFSMLLKGRGVDIDQKVIRRYRPEFAEGYEYCPPENTDIINSDMMSEIYQYSSLVDKVCPNTKMCKMNRGGDEGADKDEIKKQVLKALKDKNAPVAFCNGYHWTTIVGVSDDGNTFYVVDSQNSEAGKIDSISADTYLDNEMAEFVWLEDIVLEKEGKREDLPGNRFIVDEKSGAVVTSIQGDAVPGDSGMGIRGNHIVDRESHMEYYVPSVIRDYSRSYQEQKEQSDQVLTRHGVNIAPKPKQPTYTKVSSNGFKNVKGRLQQSVEKNIVTDRKCALRDFRGFSQTQIDALSEDEANRCYDFLRANPTVKIVPDEVFNGDKPRNANAVIEKGSTEDNVFLQPQVSNGGNENSRSNDGKNKAAAQSNGGNQKSSDLYNSGNTDEVWQEYDPNAFEEASEKKSGGSSSAANREAEFGVALSDEEIENLLATGMLGEQDQQFEVVKDDQTKTVGDLLPYININEYSDFGDEKDKEDENPENDKKKAVENIIPKVIETDEEKLSGNIVKKPAENKKSGQESNAKVIGNQNGSMTEKKVNLLNAQMQPSGNEIKEPEYIEINESDDERRANFAKLGRELERAKTTFNSKQYDSLTKVIQILGDDRLKDKVKRTERITLMMKAAQTVDEYIAHKAKDGVKENVFKKLSAVEAVSRYLEKTLKHYGEVQIPLDGKLAKAGDFNLSFQSQLNAASPSAKKKYEDTVGKNTVDKKFMGITDKKFRETAVRTHVCMKKILLRAANGEGNLPELNAMRMKFEDEEFITNALSAKKEVPTAENNMRNMRL